MRTNNKRTAIFLGLTGTLVLGSAQVLAQNTAYGTNALFNNGGYHNSAFGYYSLFANTIGTNNTASGVNSLYSNTTASVNSSRGYSETAPRQHHQSNNKHGLGLEKALHKQHRRQQQRDGQRDAENNNRGNVNNATGPPSMYSNTTGTGNSAQGYLALFSNTTGNNNVAIGNGVGAFSTTGNSNVFIGQLAGANETGSNRLFISNNSTTPLLYGQMSATPVPAPATLGLFGLGLASLWVTRRKGGAKV